MLVCVYPANDTQSKRVSMQGIIGDPATARAIMAGSSQLVHHFLSSDSNCVFAGHGWDHGLQYGLLQIQNMFSTGFVSPNANAKNGFGTGYKSQAGLAAGDYTGAPTNLSRYSPSTVGGLFDYLYTASTDLGGGRIGLGVDADWPGDVNAALSFDMWWGSFDSGDGSFRAAIRHDASPFTTLALGAVTSTNTGNAGDLHKFSLALAAGTRNYPIGAGYHLFPNQAIEAPFFAAYCRLRNTDRTAGFAFTPLVFIGGVGTRAHLNALLNATDLSLSTLFGNARSDSIAAGKEPKVIFWINSGFGDRGETLTSEGPSPVADGDSPEAYADNCRGIINRIEGIWAANGWSLNEVHFVLMPSHPITDPDDLELWTYRAAAAAIAVERTRVLAVDINQIHPSGDFTAGSWYDGGGNTHLAIGGFEAVGASVINAIQSYAGSDTSSGGPTALQIVTAINSSTTGANAATAATNTAAIKAKTDLIGTGTTLVSAPVTDDGGLLELVIGDDYLAANGRALEWTFSEISGITTSAVGRFGLADAATGTEVYQNTSGTVTEPTAGTFKVSFDIPKAALASLPPGDYNWSVQVTEGSYCITLAKNRQNKTRVKLVTKQTTCS